MQARRVSRGEAKKAEPDARLCRPGDLGKRLDKDEGIWTRECSTGSRFAEIYMHMQRPSRGRDCLLLRQPEAGKSDCGLQGGCEVTLVDVDRCIEVTSTGGGNRRVNKTGEKKQLACRY